MSPLDEYEEHRAHLFGVAYRMLGSVAEAEDVVQDAWLRWSAVEGRTVDEPRAFLVTVVTRLALDRLRSARHRRESYVGPWLPEPLPGAPGAAAPGQSPEEAALLADSLTFAFLVMLDQLGPVERVVLLLHDVFGYGFSDVAAMVGRSEGACRQLASRARRRLGAGAVPEAAITPTGGKHVDAFLLAMASGDVDAVVAALSPDVVLTSDGGPDHRAARRPVVGPARVARLLLNLASRLPDDAGVDLRDINGEPGMVITVGGRPYATIVLSTGTAGIAQVWLVRNPDKLAHLAPPSPAG